MTVIASNLIGCKVTIEYDNGKTNKRGKIIGAYNKLESHYKGSSSSCLYFIILRDDNKIIERSYYSIKVDDEDFKKIYNNIKPEPISSRSEILDI